MKRYSILAIFLVVIFIASNCPSFAWTKSKYQIEISKYNQAMILKEYNRHIKEFNKEKAFETYQVYRLFDSFGSRELFLKFENVFGKQNYDAENLDNISEISEQEEANVIMAALKEIKKSNHFVVVNESFVDFSEYSPERIESNKSNISEMASEVWCCYKSFLKNNSGKKLLRLQNIGNDSFSEISRRKLRLYFPKKGRHYWEEFKKRYPFSKGYYSFSKVGFNKSLDKALLQMDATHERGFFYGKFLYFEKIDGKWTKVSERELYIS